MLVEDLKIQYPLMAIDEVLNTIDFGSSGRYTKDGEFVHLSVTNVLKWCGTYETTKREILSRQIKYLEKQKIEKEEKEKEMSNQKKYWQNLGTIISKQKSRVPGEPN